MNPPHHNLVKKLLTPFLLISLAGCVISDSDTDRDSDAAATYRVVFTTNWTSNIFPVNFPGGAHFSGLVGATHNDQVKFWQTGQLASIGIESMAETGNQDLLLAEVAVQKASGKAEFALSGSGGGANESLTMELDINEDFPLVTLVSMVAPSPDWFVGVRDLSLFDDTADEWLQSIVVNLKVYDAGTDDGVKFTSGNDNNSPAGIIDLLTSQPGDTDFVAGVGPGGEFIATMSFTRIQ